MTNPNYTHISILVDESTSMSNIATEMVEGFNSFIEEQKKVGGYCTVTLAKFATNFSYVNVMNNITQIPKLTRLNYFPNGSTALLASQMKLIEDTGAFFNAMAEENRPSKVLFLTISDGEENMSNHISWYRHITEEELRNKIAQQRDVYNWEFVYLGTSEQGVREAIRTGYANNIKFNKSQIGETFTRMAAKTSNYRLDKSYRIGTFSNDFFAEDEIKEVKEVTD